MQRNLQEAIDRLNDQMQKNGRDLRFSMDKELDRPIITVKSSQTGEVVRQIPNEVVIKIAHNIENVKGMLHNKSI
jgi:flagellar protein FlaG